MALVENDVVKMEWEKSGWLQTKKGTFVFASKNFLSSLTGEEVTVFFRPETAFVWNSGDDFYADDYSFDPEDFYNAKEMKSWIKDGNFDDAFPEDYDEFVPIIPSEEDECLPHILEKLGLSEFGEEIAQRRRDIEPYGIEEEVEM